MFSSLIRAFAQLPDPRFRRLLAIGVGTALLVWVVLNFLVVTTLSQTTFFAQGWAETLVDVLGGLAGFVITLIFFPGVVSIVIGFLLENVAAAVEERHYPGLPPPRRPSLPENVATTLRFAAVAVALNLVALPFYLLLMFTGLGLVAFYALNGYLLSREYFELVALRRISAAEASALRRAHRGYLWVAGAGITFLLSLPLVNLVAPIVATAFMVHLFQSLRQPRPAV